MDKNQTLISWVSLIIAVFAAGAMLMGTCNTSRYLKKELKDIRADYRQINDSVKAINDRALQEEAEILQTIEGTYAKLDSLHQLKANATNRVNRTRRARASRPGGVSGFNLK